MCCTLLLPFFYYGDISVFEFNDLPYQSGALSTLPPVCLAHNKFPNLAPHLPSLD